MSLREQFEAWCKTERNHNDLHRVKKFPRVPGSVADEYMNPVVELAWQAFQAGHAVNADLLLALDGVMNSIEAYQSINNPRPESTWDEYDYVMIPRWRAAYEAIKKARAE